MTMTEPLIREQQWLLQRLIAAHVMNDDEARKVFAELQVPNDTLEDAFCEINQQLTKGFGLEIATVVLGKNKNKKSNRHHSIINSHADEVAKKSFQNHFNPHEMALIRLILQKLVAAGTVTTQDNQENQDDQDDDDQDQNDASSSSSSSLVPRKDLINLRGDLQEPYKLTLAGAEHVVELLLEEEWLRIADAVDDDGDDNGHRRESMQIGIELAPRTYLELSHLLVEMGVPQDDLPQFLFHRL